MKRPTNMTLSREFLPEFDRYLHKAGLNRSQYIDNIIIKDVTYLNSIINENTNPREIKQIVINYFRGKIGEGEQ
jgi:hypothetical protein